jgi:hypothetical protein
VNWEPQTVAACHRLVVFLSSVAILLLASPAAYGAGGDLDVTFDGDGRLTTDLGGADSATAVALQPDGKIIAVGTSFENPGLAGFLVRYDSTGALDTTFDGDGIVDAIFFFPADVAVQDDGKILSRTNGRRLAAP